MHISSFFSNQDLVSFVITLAAQSILISIFGITVIKLLSKRAAPVRSLVCTGFIAALGLVLLISVGFRLSGISWSQPAYQVFSERVTIDHTLSNDPSMVLPVETVPHIIPGKPQPSIEKHTVKSDPIPSSYSFQLDELFIPVINLFGFIWLLGLLFQMTRLGFGVVQVKNFKTSLKPVTDRFYNEMVRTVSGTFWKNRVPQLYISRDIESPVTIGFFNPVIIIPEKLFETLRENELKSILLHELAHIYNLDQIMGIIKRIVQAIHWWNPLVYTINGEHEQAREEVSDNYVLRELHPKIYTRCLANLAEKVCLISNLPATVGMAGRYLNLPKRVEHILSTKRSVAMHTKLYLKIITFTVGIVLTFGIAGLHGKVKSTTPGDGPETRSTLSPVTLFEEGQEYFQETIVEKNQAGMEIISNVDEAVQGVSPDKSEVQAARPATAVVNTRTKTKIYHDKQAEPESTYKLRKTVLNNDKHNSIVLAKIEPAERISTTSKNIPEQTEGNITQVQSDTVRMAMNKKQDNVEEQNEGIVDYFSRGKTYLEKGQIENAISDLNKAVELNPEDASTYFYRGNAYFKNEQYDRAVFDYSKAIELDPGYTEAYVNRGKIYNDVKNLFRRAIADLSKAIELNPEDAVNYYLRGNLVLGYEFDNHTVYPTQVRQAGKRDERRALSDYDMAIKLNPKYDDAYVKKGYIYFKRGDYYSAIENNAKALDLNPDNALAKRFRLYYFQRRQLRDLPYLF